MFYCILTIAALTVTSHLMIAVVCEARQGSAVVECDAVRGKARQGKARQGKARQGKARQGNAVL
jgi:hypothetical protein